VRRALTMAIDRGAIAKVVDGDVADGLTLNATNPCPRLAPDAAPGHDPATAGQLLDEAGWTKGADGVRAKDGKRLKMLFQTSINAPRQKTQAIVKQAAAKAGIELELKSVTASVYFSSDPANLDTFPHFSTDIQMFTTTMTQPDPEIFMNQFTSWEIAAKANKWQGRNATRWKSDEYDKVYRAAESEMDPVKRAAMFIKMNDLVIQNVVVIPVVQRPRVTAVSNTLRVEQSGWDSDFWSLHDWYREA
jgi:peptide/nickel transport system substrate-binding protein